MKMSDNPDQTKNYAFVVRIIKLRQFLVTGNCSARANANYVLHRVRGKTQES